MRSQLQTHSEVKTSVLQAEKLHRGHFLAAICSEWRLLKKVVISRLRLLIASYPPGTGHRHSTQSTRHCSGLKTGRGYDPGFPKISSSCSRCATDPGPVLHTAFDRTV